MSRSDPARIIQSNSVQADSRADPLAGEDFTHDLLLALDRSRPRALRAQLEHQLREAIQEGRLAAGSALPPSRALASGLEISRSVVVEAYGQLVAEGYLEARTGSATRVRSYPSGAPATDEHRDEASGRFQFRSGLPDAASFPRHAWLRHYRSVLSSDMAAAFGYPPAQGESELRVALSSYLARVRAVRTTPDQMLICGGFSQGLVLICRALGARGATRVAVEDPCFSMHRRLIRAAGLEPVPVRVDREGIDVSRLAELAVDAALVAPAHSYPTGVVLSSARRAKLVEWARRTGALVIEDDYDAEFRYDRAPIGALQGLAPARVVYGGTASKTLSPALRLGWLAAPADLVGELVRAKFHEDLASEALSQRTLARFIEEGGFARHLRRVRPIYRRRRDELIRSLAEHLPEAGATGVPAGLQLFIRLPEGLRDADVQQAARARGVHVEPTTRHWADRDPPFQALLIGFGAIHESAIEGGVQRLAAAIRSLGREI
jgi:GntR family transcriptional regulator/MocR family aminotransferase